MYPGLPTSLSGAYVIQAAVDEEVQGNLVTHFGKPCGIWYDDTVPDLDDIWLPKGVAKYGALGQKVFVCVASGDAGLHHQPLPPIVNLYEYYPIGEGVPESAWPSRPPKYRGYVVQWRFPGMVGKVPPTRRQRARLLARVLLCRPRYVFRF